jgi:hypothetical protein
MIATLRYVLLTAFRDRLFFALPLLGLGIVLVAEQLGKATIAEGDALAVVYGAAAIRLLVVLGLVAFIAFSVARMHETREIEAILARPISRARFVIAYAAGYGALASLLTLSMGLFVGLFLKADMAGFAVWLLSLMLEAWIIAALTLAAALILERAVLTVLFVTAFYVLSRLIGFFLVVSASGLGRASVENPLDGLIRQIMDILGLLLPRLDLFSRTEWLVHGPKEAWVSLFIAQAVIYVPLLLAMAVIDLRNKRF